MDDDKKLFCPSCGQQHVTKGRGVFVEVGEYDEVEGCNEEEWDGHEYVCEDCGKQFAY